MDKQVVPSNNTLEQTLIHRGRFVLELECVLAEAQCRWQLNNEANTVIS